MVLFNAGFVLSFQILQRVVTWPYPLIFVVMHVHVELNLRGEYVSYFKKNVIILLIGNLSL